MQTELKNNIQDLLNAKMDSDAYLPSVKAMKKMGISKGRFVRILNNTAQPTLLEAIRISNYFNLPLTQIAQEVPVDIKEKSRARVLERNNIDQIKDELRSEFQTLQVV